MEFYVCVILTARILRLTSKIYNLDEYLVSHAIRQSNEEVDFISMQLVFLSVEWKECLVLEEVKVWFLAYENFLSNFPDFWRWIWHSEVRMDVEMGALG